MTADNELKAGAFRLYLRVNAYYRSALAMCWSFPRAREGGASAGGFDRRRRRAAIGSAAASPDRIPPAEVRVRVNCLLVAALARARNCLGRRFRSAAPARSYGSVRRRRRAAMGDCSARADRKRWPRAALTVCWPPPSRARGIASAGGFDRRLRRAAMGSVRRRRRAAMGDCSARADRKRWPRGGCGVCALWHFRLGDRALDPGRRAPNSARPILVAGAGRQRGSPLFSVWDLEIGGGGALRQQPLATAGRRTAFGCARTVLDFGIGRARPLLEFARQGVRVNCLLVAALARARNCLGRRFRSAAPARSYGVCSAAPARSYGGLFGASRSNSLAEGRVNCLLAAALARARNRPGRRFRSAAPARSYGVCSAAPARSYGGLFGASRSKTLAEGWLWRVCALAFQAG